jgi:hypothetical protein
LSGANIQEGAAILEMYPTIGPNGNSRQDSDCSGEFQAMDSDRQTRIFDVAEDFAENASSDPQSRWVRGVVWAGLLAAYGVRCVVLQRAMLPRTRPLGLHELLGDDAIALGCVCLSLAAALHAHWFWSGHPQWHGYGQIGKFVAMVAVVASVAWLLYEMWWVN